MADIQAELAELRAEVEALKARESIRQQLSRYGRGQEWLDASLMDEVFFEDADIDFGFFKGVWRDYRPVLMDLEAGGDTTYHLLASEQIALTGPDTAEVEAYGLAGGRRGADTQIYGGRYLMRFERREGVWKAAACRYVLDWTIKQTEATAVGAALGGINQVTDRSPSNPWFRRLGMAQTG